MTAAQMAVVSFTPGGKALAQRIAGCMLEPMDGRQWNVRCAQSPRPLQDWCREQFARCDCLVFIGAMGIAVRTIAPFLKSKTADPAVLVADERGNHIISVLGGHLGGGNALTRALAQRLDADPVITTASDVNGLLAVDVFAKKNHLYIESLTDAREAAAAIVAKKPVKLCCPGKITGPVPEEISYDGDSEAFHIVISPYLGKKEEHTLRLIPRAFVLGIGCRKGKTEAEIEKRVLEELAKKEISVRSILAAASIDLKKDEKGLLDFCQKYEIPVTFYTAEQLQTAPGTYQASEFVGRITGVDNVCGRAAVLRALESLRPQNSTNDGNAGRKAFDREDCRKWGISNPPSFEIEKSGKDGVTAALVRVDWGVQFDSGYH